MRPALAVLLLLAGCAEPPAVTSPVKPGSASGPGNPPVLFSDIALAAGLDFEHFAGVSGRFYMPEIMGAGGALFDADGDGDLDVLLLQGEMLDPTQGRDTALLPSPAGYVPGCTLYFNTLTAAGNPTFVRAPPGQTPACPPAPMGVATGDVDNDGDQDLYITGFRRNSLLLNTGAGVFLDVTEAAGVADDRWSTSAAFVDYDRDGDLDLYVANYVAFGLDKNYDCATAGGQRDYCGPRSFPFYADSLFRNEGSGRFRDVSAESGIAAKAAPGLGVVAADFDLDGWPDLYVANDGAANLLWQNQGDGRFADEALMSGTAYNADGTPEAGMGVTAGDFDADGDDDLFMTHLQSETNTLYLNDGRAGFFDATDRYSLGHVSIAQTGFGTRWFDYDRDGFQDLYIANGNVHLAKDGADDGVYPYAQKDQLLNNTGGTGFRDVSGQLGEHAARLTIGRGVAVGDVDNDGDLDVLVTNNSGPVTLLQNRAPAGGGWLGLVLEGAGPRDATGARVALLVQGQAAQWRRSSSDGSYLSASDRRVLLALPDEAAAEVGVIWSDGVRERFAGLAAGRYHPLVQGAGLPWERRDST